MNGLVAEQCMMGLYARMTQKYIKERNSIPDGNLVEVRYEDMITNPFQQL
jgi:hypothetical protein